MTIFEQRPKFCVSRHKMSLHVMEHPSKEVLENVRGEFCLEEQRVRDAIELLKDWIRLQHHLQRNQLVCFRHSKFKHNVHNSS